MDAANLIGLVGSGTVGAVAIAIINGVIGRKKLGADVTKIATDAAGGVIERLEGENVRQAKRNDVLEQDNALLHDQVDGLRQQLDKMRRDADRDRRIFSTWRRAQRETSQLHAAWDALAIQKMREGTPPIDIPDAPPLTPPTMPFLSDDDIQV